MLQTQSANFGFDELLLLLIPSFGSGFNTQIVTCMVAQVFMSWLCAMVGYDKVIQAISQFKTNGEDE